MARGSIIKRGKGYTIVYRTAEKRQKWESGFTRRKQAEDRLRQVLQVEYSNEPRLPEIRLPKHTLGNGAGYVYFIQAGSAGLIKIGWSKDPEDRRRALQTGSSERLRLVGIVPGARTHEGEIQNRFRHAHLHTEWYKPTADLLEYIETLRGSGD